MTLRLPRFFEWLGWALIGLALVALIRSFPLGSLTAAGVVLQMLLCLMIAAPGVVFVLEGRNQELGFDTRRFYVTDVFGRLRGYDWSEIVEISSTGTSSLLKLRLRNGRKVTVSHFFLGFMSFVEALEHHTGFRLRRPPKPVLWWVP